MRVVTADGVDVSRLILAGHESTTARMVSRAVTAGVNGFFFYRLSFEGLVEGLRQACGRGRDRVFAATGTEDRSREGVRDALDRALRELRTDYLDAFFAEYCAPSEDDEQIFGDDGALSAIETLKAEGRVRYVCASAHSREVAVRLIESGRVDILMHRYNMAHRKCETTVMQAASAARVPVAAFTCTRWGSLLKGHPRWEGAVPRASDCYRYTLANPAVPFALMAPSTPRELEENLDALSAPPPDDGELTAWRAYGDLVYGEGTDAFETRWP